jgi:hypothetical protein
MGPRARESNAQNEPNFEQPDRNPEANCANKAKLGQDGTSGERRVREVCCAKQSQLCKTNPISPERPGMGADGRDSRGRNVQNEPNWTRRRRGPGGGKMQNEPNSPRSGGVRGPRDVERGANCAKRTQFREVGRQVEPPYSTIPSFHHSNPMPIVRNEPNSARFGSRGPGSMPRSRAGTPNLRRGECAKRTQFAACRPAATARLTVPSHLQGARLYWMVIGSRKTVMERGRL